MALVKLGNRAVGSTVKLKVGGVATEFLVVHQGLPGSMYDASCNGTWLLMEGDYNRQKRHSLNVNRYESCDLDAYLNSTFLGLFEADIQAVIKQAKIPYRANGGLGGTNKTGSNGLPRKIFLLSCPEVNLVGAFITTGDGAALDYFKDCGTETNDKKRVVYFNGSRNTWWLRSPNITSDGAAAFVTSSGGLEIGASDLVEGVRPALILPSTLSVSDDGTVFANTAPATPSTITVPAQINGGSTITISWGASTDAEGNLEGYKVERSSNGGSTWTQIYQGSAKSTTNTVAFGTVSVMYRVKAYDAEGLESGWRTSAQVTVINNTAPTVPSGITVPEEVQGGQPLAISWGASTDGENNLAGYSLERQVDGGGWQAIFTGNARSFTDSVTKGWQTVAYRVRAYDAASAYSGFVSSKTRTVNNNTPPVVTCASASGSNLGTKGAGFMVSYSIADAEGDQVSVTEAVDGVKKRTFTATLGSNNSFSVTGEYFMKILNGQHTLSITASDGKVGAVHKLTFTKKVTSASVTLEQPMEADGPISVCVLSVSGSIPLDAEYSVEVTNNALDDEPVWEDCTAAIRARTNHVFENKDAANGFAFSFRLNVGRGPSGVGGYITSVQGGFQ